MYGDYQGPSTSIPAIVETFTFGDISIRASSVIWHLVCYWASSRAVCPTFWSLTYTSILEIVNIPNAICIHFWRGNMSRGSLILTLSQRSIQEGGVKTWQLRLGRILHGRPGWRTNKILGDFPRQYFIHKRVRSTIYSHLEAFESHSRVNWYELDPGDLRRCRLVWTGTA